MRLTSVAQMVLPPGRLRSYVPSVEPTRGARVPVSFDQARHVARGARPGSWMAVAVRPPSPVDDTELASAWLVVLERHGTMRTAFSSNGSDVSLLEEVTLGPGVWLDHEVPTGGSVRTSLRDLLDDACSPYAVPSHRLCLVEPDGPDSPAAPDSSDSSDSREPRPTLVIASDHAHVDMWSLLVLVRDLLVCLDDVRANRHVGQGLPTASDFADHTRVLEATPPTPASVRRRWDEILRASGDKMPTFPLPLGDLSSPVDEVLEVRDVLDAVALGRLESGAREAGVRLIAVAASVMTRVTADLAGSPLRAVFPVHSRYEKEWHDAVGWFITNAVLECVDADPVACAASVAEAIGLGSHPLAPIMAPYGGMPERPGMFALSWMDGRRMPVSVAPELELQLVSAVIRTDGVMVWFVVTEDGLHLRCRYPDTPQARASVGRWLDAVAAGLADAVKACPGSSGS